MKKILVIDDNEAITKILRNVLKKAGFEVVIAVDGVQGIQFAHKESPDLIILDFVLPVGSGFSVLKTIKLSSNIKHIPIVIFSGMREQEYKSQMLEAGADAFVNKPLDMNNPDELIQAIKKMLAP